MVDPSQYRRAQAPRTGRGRPPGSIDRRGRALPVQGIGYARDKAALHIGPAIQREREAVDVSAEELAGRLGVAVGTLHGWESARSCPSVANLLRVAWALGCRVSALMEDVE